MWLWKSKRELAKENEKLQALVSQLRDHNQLLTQRVEHSEKRVTKLLQELADLKEQL